MDVTSYLWSSLPFSFTVLLIFSPWIPPFRFQEFCFHRHKFEIQNSQLHHNWPSRTSGLSRTSGIPWKPQNFQIFIPFLLMVICSFGSRYPKVIGPFRRGYMKYIITIITANEIVNGTGHPPVWHNNRKQGRFPPTATKVLCRLSTKLSILSTISSFVIELDRKPSFCVTLLIETSYLRIVGPRHLFTTVKRCILL